MPHLPDEFPTRRKLPHGTPPWIRHDATFLATIGCTPRGVNQLGHDAPASTIWESLEFRQIRSDWFVQLWLLMPDHLLSSWKEIIAKKTAIPWQRDYFDHRLRTGQSLREKEAYIRENPVRKGLVRGAADWKFLREP
ncbi:MAG: hypothetical protein ACOZE5_15895 [Verrucomicrobiota bacterium]